MVCVCVCVRHVYMMNACQSQMLEKERAEKETTISLCAAFIKRAKKKRDFCSEMCACGYFVFMHATCVYVCIYCACICVAGVRLCVRTHAAIDRLAADSGLTSATSLAFCIAVFWLAASSCSSSSYWRRRESSHWLESTFNFHKLANIADQIRRHNPYICFTD